MLSDLMSAAMAARHDNTSTFRDALEARLEPIVARAQRELDLVREQLEAAQADLGMARIALADSRTLLAARAERWEVERAQLVDAHLAQARVLEMLRTMPGRGEGRRPSGGETVVYVCGASAQLERAERMIASLREIPHVHVALNWPAMVRRERDGDHTPKTFRDLVLLELRCARDADVLVFLHPEDCSTVVGWAELGAALLGGLRKPTVLVSRFTESCGGDCVMCEHGHSRPAMTPLAAAAADVVVPDDAAAVRWLRERSKR